MNGAPSPQRPHLRLVDRSVADGRAPVGRTKIFRLTDPAFEQLIDVALRLEARR